MAKDYTLGMTRTIRGGRAILSAPPEPAQEVPITIEELVPTIPITEKEKADRIRLCEYLFFNGVGKQRSIPRFEVLHACGGWTWAHKPFCSMCGAPLEIEARHQALLEKHAHKMESPLAAKRPFAAAVPSDEDASPAHGLRPLDPQTLQPVGSFHNPIWAQRGPLPGNPEIVRPSMPSQAIGQEPAGCVVAKPRG